jgi:hypothetical protein
VIREILLVLYSFAIGFGSIPPSSIFPKLLPETDPTADLTTQDQLVQAAKIPGIRVLDHVIVSRKGYFSFQENGMS